jgi:hypothetical protein
MSNIRPSNLPIEETDLIGFVHTDRGVAGSAKFNLANVSSALNLDGMATQAPSAVAITGGTINGTTIGGTTAAAGTFTNLTGSTKVATPFVDATTSAGGQLRNASGTSQLAWGAGGGSNLSLEVPTNINPANGSVSIAPTGTGTVTINPATAGTVNNMAIGGTTAAAGAFTTLSSSSTTTLNGTTIPASSTLLVSGGALGTPSSGTVTNLTGTASININGTVGATTPSTGAFTTLTATTGEFSGGLVALPANGVLITSSSANSVGFGKVTPSGSATQSNFILYAGSDTANANFLNIKANNFETMLDTNKSGTGTTQPLVLKFDGVEVGRLTSTGLAVTGALSSTTGANFATSSGNVGIGTASPADRLHVGGSSPIIRVEPSTATQGATTRYINTGGTFFSGIDSSAGGFGVAYSGVMWHGGAYPLLFGTSNTERLRIDSGGNVGIGTASPGSKLDVNGEIRIGNTVNTVSPTSPDRTITMVIGGTTYYIHAKTTND